jgi:hypothetical protein
MAAPWTEIERVRKNPHEVGDIVARLIALYSVDLDEWEDQFLHSMQKQAAIRCLTVKQVKLANNSRLLEIHSTAFTTRQIEKLLEVRDNLVFTTTVGQDFSVKILLQRCVEARLDLSENDEQWVLARSKTDPVKIRRKDAGRLMRCARQLCLVDEISD